MKNLLAVVMVLGVSILSAQDLKQFGVALQAKTKDESLCAGRRFLTLNGGPAIAPRNVVMDAESIVARFSDGKEFGHSALPDKRPRIDLVKRAQAPKSYLESLREEMKSWTGALPDLSASWLGVFCYIRNPLKYMLVPDRSYAHELGFRTGEWLLSVDGIKSNTLQELNIILQFHPGKAVSLFVKRSETYYNLDVNVSGKLPWQ